MPTLIQRAKAAYQFGKATIPEVWARSLHPYSEATASGWVRATLAARLGERSGQLNFIMAVPIVNWETTLIEHAGAHGTCHHIAIPARQICESTAQWQAYKESNLATLEAGFDEAYREGDTNILFLYLSEFHIDPARLAAFRRKNVVIVHFNWDDRLHYTSHHRRQSLGIRKMAKAADFNLTMAVGPMSRYMADGAPVFYWWGLPDPEAVEPVLPPVEIERVLFFGSRYGYRAELVDHLSRKGLPIDVYGSGWGTEFISYEQLAHQIPRYALNLGVSTIGYTRGLSCVKGRDIEVPSAGGLYLTNDNPEIRQVYVPGDEILTYKSPQDCCRKACDVLRNPAAYARVRANGARKAQAFSWAARFRFLVALVHRLTDAAPRQSGPLRSAGLHDRADTLGA